MFALNGYLRTFEAEENRFIERERWERKRRRGGGRGGGGGGWLSPPVAPAKLSNHSAVESVPGTRNLKRRRRKGRGATSKR